MYCLLTIYNCAWQLYSFVVVRGAKYEIGGHGVQMGGRAPLAPPLATAMGFIEIKVVLMSGHYSELKDVFEFE